MMSSVFRTDVAPVACRDVLPTFQSPPSRSLVKARKTDDACERLRPSCSLPNTTTTEVPYGRNKPSIHLSRRMFVTAVV